MPSRQFEQWSFRVGEPHPDNLANPTFKLRDQSLKSALNTHVLIQGPIESRPGSTRIAAAQADGRQFEMLIEDLAFVLVLTNARFDVWDRSDGSFVQTVGSCAWTTAELEDLVIEPYGSSAYITHPDMPTQIITRSSAGVWSKAAWAPLTGSASSKRQPYYRFAAPGVTLTPSGVSGSITLLASAATFVTAHIGLRFRLQNREVLITAVTDSTHATATVLQKLFPTATVPVSDTDPFEIGDLIEGQDSAAKGEVTAKAAGQLTVLMQTLHYFTWISGSPDVTEVIIGPNGRANTITAAPSATTNAAVLDWTEQAISAYRGYPATTTVHRNRLWFAGLPQVPFGILGSAIGDFTDFEVGTNDDEAIFETLGDASAGEVRHLFSAEQMLIMTSRAIYYVPESEANPIRPTSMEFLKVGPEGASACRPIQIAEGVVYANATGGGITAILPTGDVRTSWRTLDLSYLHSHLIKQPRAMAYVAHSTENADRYIYVVNGDGTMAVISYSATESDAVPGIVPWSTTGLYRQITASDGVCWALATRDADGTPKYWLEKFDEARLVDGAVDVVVGDLQGAASGETIQTPNGDQLADYVYRAAAYAGLTASLLIDGAYIGEVTCDNDGDFGVPDLTGAIELGFGYVTECVPWPTLDAQDQRARRRKRRITRANIRWQGRYMTVNGQMRPLYQGDEDMSATPPQRDETRSWPCFGWSFEPTVTISKPYPAPWRLLGYTLEVKS